MTFSVMSLRMNGTPAPALCVGNRHWALADVVPEALQPEPGRGLMNAFEYWERTEPLRIRAAESLADGTDITPALPPPAGPEDTLAPLLYPRKVVLTGDVIATGCPSRLKSAWGRHLSPGDVPGKITGLGRLSVEIVKDH